MRAAETVAVAVHDGYFGCGTGAGAANREFLAFLSELLLPEVRLVVLPVRLAPESPEYHADWHAHTRALLARAEVRPVDNGTAGRDRFGRLPHFQHLAREAGRVLHELAPDLCIGFDVPFFGLAETAPPSTPLVLVPRSTGLLHQPQDVERIAWEQERLRTAVRRGARVGSISRFMGEHLRNDYGVAESALVPLPDGLSKSDISAPVAEIPDAAQHGFVLSFGRAEPYKGFQDFVEALHLVHEHVPHVVLAATSEGTGLTAHQSELAAGLQGISATFLGDFDLAIRGMLRHPALRAVVVPSRSEPFGRVPLECYAAGAAPVVATRTGGLCEQIEEGRTGFLAEPADPSDLTRALSRALRCSEARREVMRRRGRALLTRFDYRATSAQFLRATGYGASMTRRTG